MDSTKKLDYRELGSYKPLFLDYVYHFDRLAPYFPGNPRDPDTWRRVAKKVSDYPRQTKHVAEVLHEQNREMGADPAVSKALDALANGALAVVTGQQVGLFGGPLYSLYKALTAVELAKKVGPIVDRPVVALFWMDADDHDFEEISSVNFIDPSQELITLRYQPAELQKGASVGAFPLESSIEELIPASRRVSRSVGVQAGDPRCTGGKLRAGKDPRRGFRKLAAPHDAGNRPSGCRPHRSATQITGRFALSA